MIGKHYELGIKKYWSFRLVHIFPNFSNIMKNLSKALKDSFAIFVGFVILIFLIALLSCSLFRDVTRELHFC